MPSRSRRQRGKMDQMIDSRAVWSAATELNVALCRYLSRFSQYAVW
jgi:hypothetical protein